VINGEMLKVEVAVTDEFRGAVTADVEIVVLGPNEGTMGSGAEDGAF
jgi:hypothetical protein